MLPAAGLFRFLTSRLHGAVLQSDAVPVELRMRLVAARPAPRGPAGLQGFVSGGGVSPRPPPAQEHAAAVVAAHHQLDARYLHHRHRLTAALQL